MFPHETHFILKAWVQLHVTIKPKIDCNSKHILTRRTVIGRFCDTIAVLMNTTNDKRKSAELAFGHLVCVIPTHSYYFIYCMRCHTHKHMHMHSVRVCVCVCSNKSNKGRIFLHVNCNTYACMYISRSNMRAPVEDVSAVFVRQRHNNEVMFKD